MSKLCCLLLAVIAYFGTLDRQTGRIRGNWSIDANTSGTFELRQTQ